MSLRLVYSGLCRTASWRILETSHYLGSASSWSDWLRFGSRSAPSPLSLTADDACVASG